MNYKGALTQYNFHPVLNQLAHRLESIAEVVTQHDLTNNFIKQFKFIEQGKSL